MPTQSETYAVVIRNLPKEHFKRTKDLEIFVRNTLARARLADAAEDDSRTNGTDRPRDTKVDAPRPEKSTGGGAQARERSHSLDPQASLPSPDVLGFYLVPRGLLRPTNTLPPWRHGDNLDRGQQVEEVTTLMRSMSLGGQRDSNCDAVVDFIHKKDARDFGDYCENNDHKQKFQVDALYPEIFTTVSAEVLLDSDLGQTLTSSTKGKGICDDLATCSGVEMKLTKSSIKFIGKDWQVAVAKYHIESAVVNFAQHLMQPDESRLRSSASSERTHQETEAKENRPLRDAASNEETDQLQDGRLEKVVTLNEKDESINGDVRRRNHVKKAGPGVAMSDDEDDPSESAKPPRAKPTPAKRNSLEAEGKEPDTIKKAKLDKEENAEEGEYTEEEQDEPSDISQGRSSDALQDEHHTGEGLEDPITKATTTQKMPFQCRFDIKSSYWSYLEREANFMKQLERTLNDTKTMKEIDIDGEKCILTISGSSESAVCKAKTFFEQNYAGFEFNLVDLDFTQHMLGHYYKIDYLKEKFQSLVFYKEKDRDMVVGLTSDINTFLDELSQEKSFKRTDSKPEEDLKYISRQTEREGLGSERPNHAPGQQMRSDPDEKQTTFQVPTSIYFFINTYYIERLDELKLLGSIEEVQGKNEEITQVKVTSNSASLTEIESFFEKVNEHIWTEKVRCDDQQQAQAAVGALYDGIAHVIATSDGCYVEVTCSRQRSEEASVIIASVKSQKKPRQRRLKSSDDSETSQASASSSRAKKASFSSTGYSLFGFIDILIHKSDLTRLSVDAIVNAANDTLQHGGGVAKVIADKAGPDLDRESRDVIIRRGKLRDADVAVTTAGNLPCKKVLHAVGPEWTRYRDQQRCVDTLRKTFVNILREAEVNRFTSVAIPPVSSGIYKVPHKYVVGTMCEAIFSSVPGSRYLKVIHLVDINDGLLNMIDEDFKDRLKKQRRVGDLVQLDSLKVEKEISKYQCTFPKGFELNGKVHTFLHKCDIKQLRVDIIACPAGETYKEKRYGVEKAITDSADPWMKKELEAVYSRQSSWLTGSILSTKAGGQLKCDALFHVVCPSWPTSKSKEASVEEMLGMMYHNLWMKAKQSGIRSIAIPCIGSGHFNIPNKVVAKVLSQTLANSMRETSTLQEVHIVDIKEEILAIVSKMLEDTEKLRSLDQQSVIYHIQEVLTAPRAVYSKDPAGSSVDNEDMDTSEWSLVSYPNSRPVTTQPSGGARQKTTNPAFSSQPKQEKPGLATGGKDNKPPVFSSDYRRLNKQDATTQPSSQTKSAAKDAPVSQDDMCVICRCPMTDPKALKCKHTFCRACIDDCFRSMGEKCPICGEIQGKITGTQPKNGRMTYTRTTLRLPGYDKCGTITISYYIPPSTQGQEHPHPGKHLQSLSRRAYLPDNREGNEILNLLIRAFDARLTFTVGQSTTTGLDDQITWNDIHHKTSTHGGPSNFGYPDPTYLRRVRDELAAKGIK